MNYCLVKINKEETSNNLETNGVPLNIRNRDR